MGAEQAGEFGVDARRKNDGRMQRRGDELQTDRDEPEHPPEAT
jgi:hypothetical protein